MWIWDDFEPLHSSLKKQTKKHFTRKVDPLMIDPYSGFKINCYSAVCMSVWGLSLFSVFSGTPHP